MNYHFHSEALSEYEDAAVFYESRTEGLGAAFTLEVEAAIQRAVESPHLWHEIEKGVRACRTHTFPYTILYSIEEDSILILAVMHLHRESGYWRSRHGN